MEMNRHCIVYKIQIIDNKKSKALTKANGNGQMT